MNKKSVGMLAVVMLLAITAISIVFLWNFFNSSHEIQAAIIAGLVSVLATIYSKNADKKREIANSHYQVKTEVYGDFINLIIKDFLFSEKLIRKELSEDDLTEKLISFSTEIIKWGNSDVIKAWNEFRNISSSGDVRLIALSLDKLLFSIRKDLGHTDDKDTRHLTKIFLDGEAQREIYGHA